MNRIKEYREKLFLSQEKLGEMMALTGSAVCYHEQGRRSVSEEQKKAYAEALNTTVTRLFP